MFVSGLPFRQASPSLYPAKSVKNIVNTGAVVVLVVLVGAAVVVLVVLVEVLVVVGSAVVVLVVLVDVVVGSAVVVLVVLVDVVVEPPGQEPVVVKAVPSQVYQMTPLPPSELP